MGKKLEKTAQGLLKCHIIINNSKRIQTILLTLIFQLSIPKLDEQIIWPVLIFIEIECSWCEWLIPEFI